MKTQTRKMAPWLAVLLCLTLNPAVKAADEADAPKASKSQATRTQPKLAEQDVWRRWKLAHDGTDAPKVAKSQKATPQTGLAEQDVWKRWKAAHDARETGPTITSH